MFIDLNPVTDFRPALPPPPPPSDHNMFKATSFALDNKHIPFYVQCTSWSFWNFVYKLSHTIRCSRWSVFTVWRWHKFSHTFVLRFPPQVELKAEFCVHVTGPCPTRIRISSDGSSTRHTRHWPWAPGIWGPPTLKICVIMSEFSPHCDARLQYAKFLLAPAALAKQQLILLQARNKITNFFNSQIAVKEKFCCGVNVWCLIMGPQNISALGPQWW